MRQMIVTFEKKGDWRWQQKDAANGKIIGASTEGYRNLLDMQDNFARVTGLAVTFNPLPKQTHAAFVIDR